SDEEAVLLGDELLIQVLLEQLVELGGGIVRGQEDDLRTEAARHFLAEGCAGVGVRAEMNHLQDLVSDDGIGGHGGGLSKGRSAASPIELGTDGDRLMDGEFEDVAYAFGGCFSNLPWSQLLDLNHAFL